MKPNQCPVAFIYTWSRNVNDPSQCSVISHIHKLIPDEVSEWLTTCIYVLSIDSNKNAEGAVQYLPARSMLSTFCCNQKIRNIWFVKMHVALRCSTLELTGLWLWNQQNFSWASIYRPGNFLQTTYTVHLFDLPKTFDSIPDSLLIPKLHTYVFLDMHVSSWLIISSNANIVLR